MRKCAVGSELEQDIEKKCSVGSNRDSQSDRVPVLLGSQIFKRAVGSELEPHVEKKCSVGRTRGVQVSLTPGAELTPSVVDDVVEILVVVVDKYHN
jgi:hypothetical protein